MFASYILLDQERWLTNIDIRINFIEDGATYNDVIYNFWINATLTSGRKIQLFDHHPFDLRNDVGKIVDCIISLPIITNINNININSISGIYLGDYSHKLNNECNNSLYDKCLWDGIRTIDGDFIISTFEFKDYNIKVGDKVSFDVIRYDLEAINGVR